MASGASSVRLVRIGTGQSKIRNIADMHWRSLAINKVIEGDWVDHPYLSRVDEIGWMDLRIGGGSSAGRRVDWIKSAENR